MLGGLFLCHREKENGLLIFFLFGFPSPVVRAASLHVVEFLDCFWGEGWQPSLRESNRETRIMRTSFLIT